MKAQGLARIGRDVELRYLNSGDAVANVSLAFSYGKKGDDGNRQTQWVDGALFGKRAEVLAEYLTKGSLIVVYLSDVHIEIFEGNNGKGHKMAGRIDDIELLPRPKDGGGQQAAPRQQAPAPRPAPRPAPAPQRAAAPAPDLDDFDDVPF